MSNHVAATAAVGPMTMSGSALRRTSAIRYRPEIDGLRAVAVVPVILFHAGFPLFSGGFVGVDVFFVISGYLITSILLHEIHAGKFSYLSFIERRARRILPAAVLVMAACFPFAWFWMLPDDLENFGQSVIATLAFSNNILLILTSGYWNTAAEFKPLLHTWSLAVEEQYYLLFPTLLVLLVRGGRSWALAGIAVIGLASLAAAELWVRQAPQITFFSLHTRAWELMTGSICAFVLRDHRLAGNAILSGAGLLMILAAVFMLDETTPFPSLYALLPVVGTALVILFGDGDGAVARALSVRPVLLVGLMSYSLYLWHQPLFAFARISSVEEPGPAVFALLTLACFLLALLSWRWVEQPLRDRVRVPRATFAAILSLSVLAVGSAAAAVVLQKGFPGRLYAGEGVSAEDTYITYNERIFAYRKEAFPDNGAPNVLVLGNSMARDFANMLLETGRLDGRNLVYRDDIFPCLAQNRTVGGRSSLDEAVASDLLRSADVVFFASGFARGRCVEPDLRLLEGLGVDHVVYVGPKQFGYNLNPFMRVPLAERSAARARVHEDMLWRNEQMRQSVPPEIFVDLIAALGGGKHVRVFDDAGYLISPDGLHLTRQGAAYLGGIIVDSSQLREILPLIAGRPDPLADERASTPAAGDR